MRLAALLLVAALGGGCAQIQLTAPMPDLSNVPKVREAVGAPVALGEFTLAPGKPAEMDAGINLRSNTVSSPIQGSFAQYLKEMLAADLKAAGLLAPASDRVIKGSLTENRLEAPVGQGSGSIAARFVVLRAAQPVYDRELRVSGTWDSPFAGYVAIPGAIGEYTALHRKLITQLLDDPAFRAALK
ncbi:hypothetical protein [Aquabacterium humicola]|uniref:hypothetical protein n=1 Tax=Aquabacterium humicola TaxID=3237377 RepID=UPI0025430F12|nr:hypothetical protein [Rubrivivax pictus]